MWTAATTRSQTSTSQAASHSSGYTSTATQYQRSTSTDATTQSPQNPSFADKLICIDPGHGINDPGTVNLQYMNGKSEAEFNFIFATHKSVSAKEIFEALREANIYVRYFNSPRIDNYLRITIGTRGEMEKLFGFLHTYLNK